MRKGICLVFLLFILLFINVGCKDTYTVQFLDKYGNELSIQYVKEGENAIAPDAPDVEGHKFVNWSLIYDDVTSDLVIIPIYEKIKYSVKFVNYDGTLLEEQLIDYEDTPSYNGSNPTKENTQEYNYEFIGWDKTFSSVTEDITYKAVYREVKNKYKVSFVNYDGSILYEEVIEYGELPSYDDIPVRNNTQAYTYTFLSWDNVITEVTCDVTYKAIYEEKINQYSISFYDEDGITLLTKVTVNYGEKVTYPKNDPVKNSTESHTYSFIGWMTEVDGVIKDDLTNVIENRNVYASFKEEIKKVSVYILINNSYGTTSKNLIENVEYGSPIKVIGNKLYVNNEMIEAIPLDNTAQYTYEFVEWVADEQVTNDTKITANFSRIVNKYKITWMKGDQILDINYVEYGQTPKYNGTTPTKESINGINYVFSGWSPIVDIVTDNAIYYAQFKEKVLEYVVSFYDEDGKTVLGIAIVEHGFSASYPNSLPTKPSTDEYTYVFDKWVISKDSDVEANLSSISSDMNVYAKYTSSLQKYTVTFVDYDGTKLFEELVEYGKLPTYYEEPSREDYEFISWDKDITEITCDITYTAVYRKIYTVTFLDYNYKILKIEYVSDGEDAKAPNNPSRDGYVFVQWNTIFTNVKEDLYVYAEYVKQYKVVFYDQYNEVIDTVYVTENGSVTPPTLDNIETLIFIKWSENLDVITSDLKVYPVYQLKTYTVSFKMPNGDIISTQTIEHGFNAITPKCPEYYYNANDKSVKLFTGFDKTFNSITSDLVINVIYDNPINSGYVVFDNKVNDDLITTDIYLILPNNTYIYGLEFNLVLDNNIYINTVTENKNSVLLANSNKLYYNYSNKENTFNISWSDANGNNCGTVKLLSVTSQLNNYNNSFVSTFTDSSIINLLISNKNNTSIDNVTKVYAIIINN